MPRLFASRSGSRRGTARQGSRCPQLANDTPTGSGRCVERAGHRASKEFLLRDLPAVTVDRATGAAGQPPRSPSTRPTRFSCPPPQAPHHPRPAQRNPRDPGPRGRLTRPSAGRLARDYLHPPARSHLHCGQHHNLTDLTDRLRRPKTRVSTKAKKLKHAGREAIRTLSVVVHDFTDASPRVHGRMTDSAYREDRY
jgi:hypothetical protein